MEHLLEKDLKIVLHEQLRLNIDLENPTTDLANPTTITHDQLLKRLKDYGQRLYKYLFDPHEWSSFLRYNSDVRSQGARVVLKLHESAYSLWNLAWEYAYDGEEFLAMSGRLLFVRTIEGVGVLHPPPVTPPLRILAVIASPEGCPELDSDHELSLIQQALEEPLRQGRVLLDVLDDATRINFQFALTEYKPHILYYTGHGGTIQEGGGENFLCLEREEDAKIDRLRPRELLHSIRRTHDLRIVFLNGCQTARNQTGAAFSGVATALLHEQVPIIIANQFSIPDPSATAFAGAFFSAIGKGQPVEEAVDTGRQAMRNRLSSYGIEGLDWGVPTAYVRSPGLRLVNNSTSTVEVPAERPAFLTGPPSILVPKGLNLPPHWVGRKRELRCIRRALRSHDTATVYIYGLGGIGKTSLAARVVETINRLEARFDDVFVFHGRTTDDWKLILTRFGEWLERRGESGHTEAGAELKGVYGTPSERLQKAAILIGRKRYLFIFDNFEAALQCVDNTNELYDIADELEDDEALKVGSRPLREFFAQFLDLPTTPIDFFT
jgi:hypothetical protein